MFCMARKSRQSRTTGTNGYTYFLSRHTYVINVNSCENIGSSFSHLCTYICMLVFCEIHSSLSISDDPLPVCCCKSANSSFGMSCCRWANKTVDFGWSPGSTPGKPYVWASMALTANQVLPYIDTVDIYTTCRLATRYLSRY